MNEFRTVARAGEVRPGEMKLVEVDGNEVVIANVEGTYFAFSNTCSHAGGPLAEGDLDDDVVTCPWHFTPFNVRTGEAMQGGVTDDPIATYEVRVEACDIQVRMP